MFGKRRRESLCASNIATDENKITTVLRVRPTDGIDHYDDSFLRIDQQDSEVTLIPPEFRPGAPVEKFKFDQVLGPEVKQPEVFKETVSNLVKAAFNGQNACLFAYGASGSGKTHTMMGKPSDPGVIPRTLDFLFKSIDGQIDENERLIASGCSSIKEGTSSELKELEKARLEVRQLAKGSSKKGARRSLTAVPDEPFQHSDDVDFEIDESTSYVIFASFYELYNEKVYDLLVPVPKDKKRVGLSVKMDHRGAYVNKLRQIRINSPNDALTLLKAGRQGLTTGTTRLNADSSRSHCLFTLRIAKRVNKSAFQVSNLAFCDLAGTERGKKLGKVDPKLLSESKTINKSLMQLRLVISDLQGLQKDGNKVVSFRNSKLTQLMEPYLVGHSHTCIMIAVSNNPENYDDTQRSLDFASTAQQIQMGIDRHGKIMKSSSKMNLSRVPSPEEEIEETVHEPMSDPYGVGTDFSDWTKQDVIDDLVYYMQGHKNLHEGIQRMKVEWQKDEQEWNEYKVSYEDRISDLKICLHNARATGTNDLIDAEERHSKKVKKLLSAIEELKNKDDAGASSKVDELIAVNEKFSEKIAALEDQVRQSNERYDELSEANRNSAERMQSEIESLRREKDSLLAEADSRRLQESELRSKIADLQEELEAERGPSPLSPISASTHVFELNSTRQLFQNEKASDKVAELEIENRQLVEDNDALNNQIEMGKEMLKMLREEKSELQNALEQAKNPDPDVEVAQNELKKQLEIYKSDLSSMEMECQKLNANLAVAIRKEKDLVDNLDQQTNAVHDLQSQRDELLNDVDTFDKRIQQLEDNLRLSENEKLKHMQALEVYKSKSESLQSEGESIKQLKQNLAVLREEFDAHHEKFEECKQKLSNEMITTDLQKEKINELQTELCNERISKDHQIASLSANLEKLKVSTSASESAAELSKQENSSLAETILSLKDEIETKDANLVEIQKKLDELSSSDELKTLQGLYQDAQGELLRLKNSTNESMEEAKAELEKALDDLSKSHKRLKCQQKESEAILCETKKTYQEEIDELSSVVATLRESAENKISSADDSELVKKLQAEIEELNENLKDKLFRSKLRKQLDKAKEEVASLRKQLDKYESKLADKENTIEDSQSGKVADPSSQSSNVKAEPTSLESSAEETKVKDEPAEEWVQPKPETPLQRIKNKLTGTRKKRQLAPLSPDVLGENSAETPPRRTRRQNKK